MGRTNRMTTDYWKIAVPLLIALVTIAVFWQVQAHEFINLDDEQYITQNPHMRSGFTAAGLTWAFTTTHASNWHPLTWLSHLLDVRLFGMDPAGHHLVSLLLHAANTLLLFFVLNRMTQALWQSAAVAFLFALHPLHVESVAWAAERKDVLSTFFLMLTLWAYARYAQSPRPSAMVPVAAFFSLGLLSKPMLVTLPFVLLLLDYWPLNRWTVPEGKTVPARSLVVQSDGKKKGREKKHPGETKAVLPIASPPSPSDVIRALVAEKVPLFALAALSSIVTFLAQQKGGAVSSLEQIPLVKRLANALISYAAYISKTLLPQGLAVFYPYPSDIVWWKVAAAAALLAALTLLALRFRKRCPYLLVGWLWYLGTLVPVIGIVQVGTQAMADRYTYVPLIGLFIAAAWGAGDLAGGLRQGRKILAVVTAAAFAGLATVTWNQLSHWRSSTTLFEHALRVTENNSVAHLNLGVALNRAGNSKEAAAHYHEALRINPDSSSGHYNLANYYSSIGMKDEAKLQYIEAIRDNPRYANAYNNLGIVLASQRRTDEAIPYYRKAVEIEPANAGMRFNYGIALAITNNLPGAVEQLRAALEIRPNYPEAHNYLGMALLMQGERGEAIRHFRQALWLKPDFTQARRNLDGALGRLNAPSESGQFRN